MLLLKIRGETIKFASKFKKNKRKETALLTEIENLESKECMTDLVVLQIKHEKLINIRNSRLTGQMVRARVQNLCLYEKPSRHFCNLEKHKYAEKTIKNNAK